MQLPLKMGHISRILNEPYQAEIIDAEGYQVAEGVK